MALVEKNTEWFAYAVFLKPCAADLDWGGGDPPPPTLNQKKML